VCSCRASEDVTRLVAPSHRCLTARRSTIGLWASTSDPPERSEQLAVLRKAIQDDLTARQREAFVAIVLNDVPIDVLALELDSNRNAIYKNLFDARRKLRASLAAAGHPLTKEEAQA
jgi:DNA-directed RNA polymerase specialized sigma24 family protein